MQEIAEKRKNNEVSNVEKLTFTQHSLKSSLEMERGFKRFGVLDLYRSQATEFLIDGDTPDSAICSWIIERNCR